MLSCKLNGQKLSRNRNTLFQPYCFEVLTNNNFT